jgi:drug/metabolite transporter (DMT)-like permease
MGSVYVFGEQIRRTHVLGMVLIMLGVAFLLAAD